MVCGNTPFVYRLFHFDSGRTWNEAKENCEAVGWRLAVLDSEDKVTEARSQM